MRSGHGEAAQRSRETQAGVKVGSSPMVGFVVSSARGSGYVNATGKALCGQHAVWGAPCGGLARGGCYVNDGRCVCAVDSKPHRTACRPGERRTSCVVSRLSSMARVTKWQRVMNVEYNNPCSWSSPSQERLRGRGRQRCGLLVAERFATLSGRAMTTPRGSPLASPRSAALSPLRSSPGGARAGSGLKGGVDRGGRGGMATTPVRQSDGGAYLTALTGSQEQAAPLSPPWQRIEAIVWGRSGGAGGLCVEDGGKSFHVPMTTCRSLAHPAALLASPRTRH